MKKGKSCVLGGYKNLKSCYGTVDAKNLKSIYINIQSWVEPIKFFEDWNRPVSTLTKNVKSVLNEVVDKIMYENKFIVDLDLRTSGISLGKRSFMNLEITLFVKKPIEFKSITMKKNIKDIVSSVQKEIMENSEYFVFHLTKKDKTEKSINI